jgi:hypothetical protein
MSRLIARPASPDCPDCLVPHIPFQLYFHGCPALVILSRLSYPSCPVLSCSGHPIVSFLPQMPFHRCPLQLSCHGGPVPEFLSLSFLVSTVLTVLSCSDCSFYLSCPGCLVLATMPLLSCSGRFVLYVLPRLTSASCPVPTLLPVLSCLSFPFLAVLLWFSCPGCLVPAVLSLLS